MIRTQLLLWLVALGWASEVGADIKLTLKHGYSPKTLSSSARMPVRPRSR